MFDEQNIFRKFAVPVVLSLGVLGASATQAASLSLEKVDGIKAVDISIGGGELWATGEPKIGKDYSIYHWNASASKWDKVPGGATRIDVGPDGLPMISNSPSAVGKTFRYDAKRWVSTGPAARDIAVGPDGLRWMVGTHEIRNSNGWNIASWRKFSREWEGEDVAGARIDAEPNGNAWLIDAKGVLTRYAGKMPLGGQRLNASDWKKVPGIALDLSIGDDGSVFVLGTNHSPFKWNGNGWVPHAVNVKLNAIAVDGKGLLWGITEKGEVYADPKSALSPAVRVAAKQATTTEEKRLKSLVDRLLKTGACRGCDLRGANLSYINMAGGAEMLNAAGAIDKLAGPYIKRGTPKGKRIDLADADLRGALIYRSVLPNVNLNSAKLDGATIVLTELRGAEAKATSFKKAKLANIYFNDAVLPGADFSGAELSNVRFFGANLNHAKFNGADTKSSHFKGAKNCPVAVQNKC